MTSTRPDTRLMGAALLLLAAALALGLPGCPRCAEYPIEVRLTNRGQPVGPDEGITAVEWSRDGSPFAPCEDFGQHFCGQRVLWGLCGPDQDAIKGEYIIRVARDDEETQERVLVEQMSCHGGQQVEINVSLLFDPPPQD